MFTGIVETTGKITEFTNDKITIGNIVDSNFLVDMKIGMSIAINGVCLTVIEYDNTSFLAEIMSETIKKTTFSDVQVGDDVNLEKALSAQGRFEGHIVQGHVDGTTKIVSIINEGNSHIFTFQLPIGLRKYIVQKGSITINGISLTVINADEDTFSVGIIPHTLQITMLDSLKNGDNVNLEVDIVGKYLEKMIQVNDK